MRTKKRRMKMKKMIHRRQEVVVVAEEVVEGAEQVEGQRDGVEEDGFVCVCEMDADSYEMIIVYHSCYNECTRPLMF